jgi:hypothetical protein
MRLAEAGETDDDDATTTTSCRSLLLDLVRRCLAEDPAARITAAAARDFLASSGRTTTTTRADNLLLPSPVLRFTLTAPAAATASLNAAAEAQLEQLQQRCAQYGRLVDTRRRLVSASAGAAAAGGCQLFVQFVSAQEAARARILLTCPPATRMAPAPNTTATAVEIHPLAADTHNTTVCADSLSSSSPAAFAPSCTGNGENNFAGRLCSLESPPPPCAAQPEMQLGFRSEFYPLELWYQEQSP